MITKSATNPNHCTRNLVFTQNARTAWEYIIKHTGERARVLLPAFIGFTEREGSGVFDPVQHTQAEFAFYKIGERLEADMQDLNNQIEQFKPTIVLVIHYFGFCPNNLNQIKAMCAGANALLVEDCAHAFHLGTKQQYLGNTGAYSFYSLHKYFATDCGGTLQVNIPGVNVSISEAHKAPIHVLEQWLKTDFEQVANIRRVNYTCYQTYLKSHSHLQVLYTLHEHDIPQTFAIRVKNNLREKLYFHLMDLGMPTTALYYRMIDAITPVDYPLSHTIASEILNLPVHQDTTEADIIQLCKAINDFMQTHA